MQKTCPSCGAETFPGARYCRRCGAHVREDVGTGNVSPQAATVPLDGGEPETRTTDELASAGERAAQTSRVSLAEMERLLRAQSDAATRPEHTPPAAADAKAAHAVPPPTPFNSTSTPFNSQPAPAQPSSPVHPSAVTRPEVPAVDGDEELTITVPRPAETRETGDFEATADFDATRAADLDATRPSDFEATRPADFEATRPSAYDPARANVPRDDSQHAPPGARASVTEARAGTSSQGAGKRRAWPLVVAVCAAVIVVVGGGAWLAFKLLRRPDVTNLPTQGPTAPPVTSDARQQYEQKLAEAESLLASGNMDGAVASLREATGLDPANPRAHRRLAELLLSTGARREAIEELRAVVRAEPEDAGVWRQLASAQFAEALYRDAAESYRRLVALVGQQSVDPADLIAYADALRLSGRAEESRALYEQLAAAAPPEIATAARQHLSELTAAQPTPAPTQHNGEQPAAQPTREGETASLNPTPAPTVAATPTPAPQPTPTPQPTPAPVSAAEHYGRGQQLWSSNRSAALAEFREAAAGGNYDAHYYLGLSYVEGRKLNSLQRAEVVAALQHFQLAQRGRQYAAESRRYEQQLAKEFDRLRRQ
ncbi:MAG TPA: tetratricopeptide repeat protein [Pyrinomonadaceae bacterium]|nr:tetratricopeptide repeat protein [Pyrinomonadaceae bacterium]